MFAQAKASTANLNSVQQFQQNEHDEHMKFIKLFLAYRSVQKSRL